MAVPPPPRAGSGVPSAKIAARRALREARARFVAGLDDATMAKRLAAIDARLSALLGTSGPIAGYVAHRGEVDILPFLMRATHLGHVVTLPYVPGPASPGDGGMHFLRWHPDAALTAGIAGIPQPAAGGEVLEPAIILTPLIGFDRTGHRLGQGGGFYDRWFVTHPDAMRIGIAWSAQEIATVPCDPWDMPLHAIVTEKEWIRP